MAMAQTLRWPCCMLGLFAAILVLASQRVEARAIGLRRLQQQISACPQSPTEHCDFFLEGYEDEIPVISLDGKPDSFHSAPLLDAISNQYAQVITAGAADFLCPHPGASAGEEFYFAQGDSNRLRFHDFGGNKTFYENSCLVIPLSEVRVQKDDDTLQTLTWDDANQLVYPDVRRCLIFTTGPNGFRAGGTCFGR